MADRSVEDILKAAGALARERLSARRYGHTLRVAYTAERLAGIHGLDPGRARLASLLHDAAREVRAEDFLRLAEEWALPVGDFERENPKLLHGPVAAELARRKLGVQDREVLDAVREHTVGAPGMSALSLALYVADKIEPGRDYPSVEKMRDLARRDLYKAAAEALRRSVAYNAQRGKPTHPASLKALEWLESTQHPAQRRVEPGQRVRGQGHSA